MSMQDGYAEVNGARIHYVVQGQGPAVLLIHGYPLSGELFSKNRDALSQSHKVITIDLRGFGKSTAPAEDPGSLSTYAKDALGVLDTLNVSKAVIGGMSMGGPIVFEMYRTAPERFSGMILIDTIANPASIVEQNLWKGMAQKAVTYGPQSLVDELLKDMLTGATRKNMPQQAAFLGDIVKQASIAGDVAGAKVLATRPDSVPTLKTITVPTLILEGLEDTVYPPVFSEKMHQNIAGSTLVVIPGAAHALTYEKADQVNQAMLSWLSSIR
ncbi:alpha/beta fold hydrolase [Deinococcus irradiatisoli]|nr:alpha/beta hydrolase [Deinococcus irradiatisoli]